MPSAGLRRGTLAVPWLDGSHTVPGRQALLLRIFNAVIMRCAPFVGGLGGHKGRPYGRFRDGEGWG